MRSVNVMQGAAAKLADVPDMADCYASAEPDRQGIFGAFPEDTASDDEKDMVCWDFDIHAAMLIRAQRDSNSYASSETSTAVSRTSFRRRGRRAAKGKGRS